MFPSYEVDHKTPNPSAAAPAPSDQILEPIVAPKRLPVPGVTVAWNYLKATHSISVLSENNLLIWQNAGQEKIEVEKHDRRSSEE